MITLRPYQEEALAAIDDAEARGVQRPLIVHPTGAGKTVTFSHMIARREGRSIVLVHRDELVQQTVNKLAMIAPELGVGVVKAERNEYGAQAVVASVQTLFRPDRLAWLNGFSTVVVDEAHHAPAEGWQRVLRHLGSFDGGPLTVGFTATPERTGTRLGVWDEVVAYKTIREMIYEGYLAPIDGQRVDTHADFSKIRKSEGDLQAGQLGEELASSGAIDEIADACLTYAAERKGVAFLPTVETARLLADALCDRGLAAEAVWGSMDPAERRAVLHRLRTGETRWVTNCSVLTEGFDEPSIDCIVIARPTTSHGLYVQMVGRGTRRYPGKADCLVLDVVGATERHDMVGVVDLGLSAAVGPSAKRGAEGDGPGLPVENPCGLCGRQLSAGLIEEGRTRHDNCRAGGTARASVFAASALRWLEVDNGYALPTDKGALVIGPRPGEDDLWRLAEYTGGRLTVLQRSVPIDWAQGIGEDRAKGLGKLTARSASWLKMRPSEAQLARLVADGFPEAKLHKITTRGQAADLITRLQGRRALRRLERQP